jgi:hypothetical protein
MKHAAANAGRAAPLAVLLACAPAVHDSPPATATPPPPGRPSNVAHIAGTVATQAGQPVGLARVTVTWTHGERVGAEACSPVGSRRFSDTVHTNAAGHYQLILDGGAGPAFVGCVDAYAVARGLIATPLSPRAVDFTSAAAPPVRLDIRMTPEGAASCAPRRPVTSCSSTVSCPTAGSTYPRRSAPSTRATRCRRCCWKHGRRCSPRSGASATTPLSARSSPRRSRALRGGPLAPARHGRCDGRGAWPHGGGGTSAGCVRSNTRWWRHAPSRIVPYV